MRSFRRYVVLAAFGSLLACRGDQPAGLTTNTTSNLFNPHITSTPQWAGGEVRVSADAFRGGAPLPALLAGTDTLAVRRVDDSTVAARMPPVAGTYALAVRAGSDTATIGNLTLVGFQSEVVGPYMSGKVALLNPGAPSPLVLSYGDSGIVVVDLAANSVVATYPDSVGSPDCAWSPGPSYRGPTYFVVQGEVGGTCRTPQVWELYPSAAVVDTSPISVFSWYVMAEVAPARWYVENNNHTHFWVCDSQPCTQSSGYDVGAWNVALSPAGHSFVPTPNSFPASVLRPSALSVNTMDTAQVFTGMGSIQSSVFSTGGDTLFTMGQEPSATVVAYTPMHVTALRSSDGAVVRDQPLDSLGYGAATQNFYALAADASGPYLYGLTGYAVDSTVVPTLVVVDRGTWSVVGVATATGSSATTLNTLTLKGAAWIVPAPALHKVFVVVTYLGYNEHQHPGAILTFNTP